MDNFFEGLPILVGMAMEWIRRVWIKFVSSISNPFYDGLLVCDTKFVLFVQGHAKFKAYKF